MHTDETIGTNGLARRLNPSGDLLIYDKTETGWISSHGKILSLLLLVLLPFAAAPSLGTNEGCFAKAEEFFPFFHSLGITGEIGRISVEVDRGGLKG